MRWLIPKIVILYRAPTHCGVQSNLQETIKVKAKIFTSNLGVWLLLIIFNSTHSRVEGRKYSRTFRVEGCPRLEGGGRWERGGHAGQPGEQSINARHQIQEDRNRFHEFTPEPGVIWWLPRWNSGKLWVLLEDQNLQIFIFQLCDHIDCSKSPPRQLRSYEHVINLDIMCTLAGIRVGVERTSVSLHDSVINLYI